MRNEFKWRIYQEGDENTPGFQRDAHIGYSLLILAPAGFASRQPDSNIPDSKSRRTAGAAALWHTCFQSRARRPEIARLRTQTDETHFSVCQVWRVLIMPQTNETLKTSAASCEK